MKSKTQKVFQSILRIELEDIRVSKLDENKNDLNSNSNEVL